MNELRYIVKMNGNYSIMGVDMLDRLKTPIRVSGPHSGSEDTPIRQYEIVKEVAATPQILAFEKVRDKLNRLAASSEQEMYYDEYNDLKELALKSVGI